VTRVVGTHVRLKGWQERTNGQEQYLSDQSHEVLHAAILRSPHPHAAIRSIDVSRALAIEGVRAVVTAADLPPAARYLHSGPAWADRGPLARDVVRFIGEEVAAVAAVDAATARRGVEAIRVAYRRLRGATTVAEALAPGAPTVHQRDAGLNLAMSDTGQWGDPELGRTSAEVAVEGRFTYPRTTHVSMERSGTEAWWIDGTLNLRTTTQSPFYIAQEVANILGIDPQSIVVHDTAVGGGFGSRSKICEHEVIVALLARTAGERVRLELSREEEFAATKTRHHFSTWTRTHATASGRISLIEGELLVDNGAYNHSGPTVTKVGIKTMGSLYAPDGVTWTARLVDTATLPGGQFRGYGGPQVSIALETQVDEIAERLGMDPIDLRILNANRPGSTALCGAKVGSARLEECLEAVRSELDWTRRRTVDRRPRRGLGVAAAMHGSGSYVGPGTNASAAAVSIDIGGRVTVRYASLDTGTGQRTVCAQVAAEELGVSPDDVDVVMGHRPGTPEDAGAWSSRGTHMAGHAVGAASRDLARELRELAAAKFSVEPDEVALSEGTAMVGEDRVDLGDLVATADTVDGVLSAEAHHVEDRMEMFGAQTPRPNFSASYTFAAHGVEVEVDEQTGRLRILDYVAAHDIGRAINPQATRGQIIGGVVMGLGAVLGEEIILEGGRVVNPSFINYPVPRADDVSDVRVVLVEGPEDAGPYDAKSVGEIPIYPVAAAVANAVYDAVGIRLRELPFTPDRVLAALAERDARELATIAPVWRRPNRWWVAMIRWLYPRGLHTVLHRWGTKLARRVERREVQAVVAPERLDEVVRAVAANPKDAVPVAGNTDLSLQRRQGLVQPVQLVSLHRVGELRRVEVASEGSVTLGATVTLAELCELSESLPAVACAASTIASPQIRAAATLGGNLLQAKRCWFFRNGFDCYKRGGATCPCYAVEGDHRFYHAVVDAHRCQAVTPSDLATVFVALDAVAHIATPTGSRSVAVGDLFTGPGETALRSGEILTSVRVPAERATAAQGFAKLALWSGDFAVVSAAVSGQCDSNGAIRDPRIVLGAVAPVPLVMSHAASALNGRVLDLDRAVDAVREELYRCGHPLENNAWKMRAAEGVVRSAFERWLEVAP